MEKNQEWPLIKGKEGVSILKSFSVAPAAFLGSTMLSNILEMGTTRSF